MIADRGRLVISINIEGSLVLWRIVQCVDYVRLTSISTN